MALRARKTVTQQRANRLVTAPGSEPITTTELKTHLRLSGSSEDTYLGNLITAARQHIENITGLAFISQTWKLTLDKWPGQSNEPWWNGVVEGPRNMFDTSCRELILPRFPLTSITSVTTYDEASNDTSVTVANVFDIDTASWPGRIALQSGATWPIALRRINAIEIVYVAGYANSDAVLQFLKQALLQTTGYMYQHRGDCSTSSAFIKSGASSLIETYSRARI